MNLRLIALIYPNIIISLFFLLLYTLSNEEGYLFCSISFLCLCAFLPSQLNNRKIDVFEPINLIYFAVFLGTAARSLLVTLQGSEKFDYLTEGFSFSTILGFSPFLFLGLLSLNLGYSFHNKRIPIERLFLLKRKISTNKIHAIFPVAIFISATGSFLYLKTINLDLSDLTSISNKRAIEVDDGTYSAYGHLKFLASFAEVALYLVLASGLTMLKRSHKLSNQIMIYTAFAFAFITPFVSSSRMDIMLVGINCLIIIYYAKNRSLPKKVLIGTLVFSVSIASGMGYLRATAQGNDASTYTDPIQSTVGSGNFVDLARTSIIIANVPEKMDYLYGTSLISWITAPIPRVIWPEKPNVSLGPSVRSEIYGLPTLNNGFPPGIVAEGYMNFGYIGLIILPFLFGSIQKLLYMTFRNIIISNPIALLIYISFLWRFSFGAIGLNFSQALVQVATDIVVMGTLLILTTSSARKANLQKAKSL
ncbi:O-antigen polysaccharide polymerase Wzy [Halopseudomonas salina]|nr:O-antigen polysaccharide polymerase Wzy [Halopseudomonas salina]